MEQPPSQHLSLGQGLQVLIKCCVIKCSVR